MKGRPKMYADRVGTQVRMSKDLNERLHAAASERDVSVNLLIVRACEAYLARLVPVDELMRSERPTPDRGAHG